MQGLVFDVSIPRYVATKALSPLFPGATRRLNVGGLSLREVERPALPGDDWVRLRTRLCGLCGSDLGTVFYKNSPILQPFYSFPAVLGHEILAEVSELGPAVTDLEVGQRVTVNPLLPCRLRRISPPCTMCARGLESGCENTAEGHFAPGILIGFHRELPGGMGEELVAHRSQLHPIPSGLSDEHGVLVEPLAVSLHAVLKHPPRDDEHVLVIGGGPIGFATLWAIRAIGSKAHVTLLTLEQYQLDLARELGADEVLRAMPDLPETEEVARRTGGKVYRPDIGPPALQGGFERIFDCVGSRTSLSDATRYCRAFGTVVLIGAAGILDGIDWTPFWAKELTLSGSFTYGPEQFRGERRHTFDVVLELLRRGEGPDPARLVTHHFALGEYAEAIDANLQRGKYRSIKTVFDLRKAGPQPGSQEAR